MNMSATEFIHRVSDLPLTPEQHKVACEVTGNESIFVNDLKYLAVRFPFDTAIEILRTSIRVGVSAIEVAKLMKSSGVNDIVKVAAELRFS